MPLNFGGILVGMAGEAESVGRGGRQLDPRDIFVHADFVAAQASSRNGGVNCLPFAFIFVALQALRRVDIFVERNRVGLGRSGQNRNRKKISREQKKPGEGSPYRCLAF